MYNHLEGLFSGIEATYHFMQNFVVSNEEVTISVAITVTDMSNMHLAMLLIYVAPHIRQLHIAWK